jgi:hypothetical protein
MRRTRCAGSRWRPGHPEMWAQWGELTYSVETGKPAVDMLHGMSLFECHGLLPGAILQHAPNARGVLFDLDPLSPRPPDTRSRRRLGPLHH